MSWRSAIGTGTILVLLPSWLGLIGSWHWTLDVLANFRWQYLIASTAAIGVALLCRSTWIALFALATLLLNAALIGSVAWNSDVRDLQLARDFRLRILSQNVFRPNKDKPAVLRHVLESDADIVLLQEVGEEWVAAMKPLEAKYPYHIALPRVDHFGLALYSRIPWSKAEIQWLGNLPVPSIEARIVHRDREFVLIGIHTMSPNKPGRARIRDQQLQLLADHVSRLRHPVLVVGDLNVTPWSAGMRIATSGNLGYRSLRPPWTPTWRPYGLEAVPIDHVLATAPFVITERTLGPQVGSDHRSLAVTVRMAIR